METVTLSPGYQVTIPSAVCKSLEIYPGQQFQVIFYQHHIELLLVRPIQTARGFLPGLDSTIRCEPDRF